MRTTFIAKISRVNTSKHVTIPKYIAALLNLNGGQLVNVTVDTRLEQEEPVVRPDARL